jgi:hypothetical protein
MIKEKMYKIHKPSVEARQRTRKGLEGGERVLADLCCWLMRSQIASHRLCLKSQFFH